MKAIKYDQNVEVDFSPFSDLVGAEIMEFIVAHAPRKVATRVVRALDHYVRSVKLVGVDEEMGAIRLIAGEEELVVAIFEWLKLNPEHFPEHNDFVGKFKNHVVKLAFYPVLRQFRFVLSDMLEQGFTMDGLEEAINWKARPVVDGDRVLLALYDNDGKEIIRTDPLALDITHEDKSGQDTVPVLLDDLTRIIKQQLGQTLREYLSARADFRNHMLYATDGGSAVLGNDLNEMREDFGETYHDLLWVLGLAIGAKPPSKTWGVVSQFIAVYRLALIEAKILKADNTIADPALDAGGETLKKTG